MGIAVRDIKRDEKTNTHHFVPYGCRHSAYTILWIKDNMQSGFVQTVKKVLPWKMRRQCEIRPQASAMKDVTRQEDRA
jgi:hypothetical protein